MPFKPATSAFTFASSGSLPLKKPAANCSNPTSRFTSACAVALGRRDENRSSGTSCAHTAAGIKSTAQILLFMTDTPSIQLVDLGLYHRQFLARDLKSEQKLLFCLLASPVLAVAIDASREN